MRRRARFGWMWVFLVGACQASRAVPEVDTPGGAVPDASTTADTSTTTPDGTAVGASPWNDSSARVEGSCFAFFVGSMRFRADRAQLSANQLELLSQLAVVDSGDICVEDDWECHLTVTQTDGSVASYDSLAGDGGCGMARKMVSFATFQPFEQTLGCQTAKAENAPLSPNPVCFNGLFSPGGSASTGGTIDLGLIVAGAGASHHVELSGCTTTSRLGHVSLQILDPTATTVLATGTPVADPGPDGTCLSVDYTFSQAGTYVMRTVTDATFTPGDYYVRFF